MKYPIGVQNFGKIRRDGYLYIDKTELVYKLVSGGSYYFLSRIHTGGLFSGKERAVLRSGYGEAGEGMDGKTGAAH